MPEGPYWGWSILGGGGLLDSNLGGVSRSMGLDGSQGGGNNSNSYATSSAPPPAGSRTPGNNPPANATTGTALSTATGNPGNVPGTPPGPGYHWQGGAPDPNGPATPRDGGRYVDPTYQHDATGRQLTPEEQAAARQYDTNRAQAASTRASANYGGASNNNPSLSGMDYNPDTKQWSYYDTTAKAWTPGKSIEDIYNTLFTDQQRAAHPLFYYQQQADDSNYSDLRHDQFMTQYAQANALAGTPTVRVAPVRF